MTAEGRDFTLMSPWKEYILLSPPSFHPQGQHARWFLGGCHVPRQFRADKNPVTGTGEQRASEKS